MADGSVGRQGGVAAALLASVLAMPAAAQTLDDAMVDAYQTSPQLGAAQAALRAIDEKVPQALSNYRPTANLLGEEGVVHLSGVGNSSLIAGDDFNFFSREAYGVRVSQPVYRGGRTEAELDGAMHTIESNRARLVNVEQAVLLSAITDYMTVVADQEKVSLTTDYERETAKYLDDTRGRLKFGAVTGTDVSQAESAASRATADRQQAEGALAVERSIYQRDTGKAPAVLSAPKGHPALPATEDELLAAAENESPGVVAAGYAERAAEADVDLADGALLPTLSLDASILHQSDVARFSVSNDSLVVGRAPATDYRIMAQLIIPIFDGGKSYSISRQARQVVSQRQSELDLARRDAQNAAAAAWEQLEAIRANDKTNREAVAANEVALDGVTHEASLGQRSVLDVVNAQDALFRSQLALVDTERDLVLKEYAVVASIGQLTAKSLGLPVQLYDPVAHFEAVRDKWFGFGTFDVGTPSEAAPEENEAPEAAAVESAAPLPSTRGAPSPPAAPAVVSASAPVTPAPVAAGDGGTVRYTRDTSVEDLPNEKMEFRGDAYASLKADSDGYDERLARSRRNQAAEEHAKWMEYGGGE
ncbi:MAG TPA: TolC family outer membrane protein [Stellaceae bacterium]|nr:TolC family outer membrane protein [Stellaceae bacterium]